MSLKSAALCLPLVIVSHPIAARAQSAGKVIERHSDAIGGKKAVERVVSTVVSGLVTSADGRSGVFTQRTKRPLLFSVSLSWGDSRWNAGFNGRSAWQDDSLDGWRTLYGQPASRVRAEASYANAHFVMSDKVSQVSVVGREEVRGHPVFVVVAHTPDGTERRLFFDAGSHLLVKDEQQTEAGVEERFFDDYRPVDQVMEPHRIEWHRNGETFRIAVERVIHNAPLDEQAFDVPAPPAEPPLDIDAVLAAARDNDRRAESLRAPYVYTETHTSRRIESDGRVTPDEGVAFEIMHLNGRRVATLVSKGGQAIGEAERRREKERVERRLRAVRSGQEDRGVLGSMFVQMPLWAVGWFPAALRMSDFSHIRREWLRGRAVAVMEFQPKRGVEPSIALERQIGTMAGTLWVDEASRQAIRIESYFRDDYNRTVQGSSMRVELALVNNEVWLPSGSETNRRLSFVFGKHSHWLDTTACTAYKRFDVEANVKVPPPRPGP
jgi:hypothetical protein